MSFHCYYFNLCHLRHFHVTYNNCHLTWPPGISFLPWNFSLHHCQRNHFKIQTGHVTQWLSITLNLKSRLLTRFITLQNLFDSCIFHHDPLTLVRSQVDWTFDPSNVLCYFPQRPSHMLAHQSAYLSVTLPKHSSSEKSFCRDYVAYHPNQNTLQAKINSESLTEALTMLIAS